MSITNLQLKPALEGFLIKTSNFCYTLRIANHWLGNFREYNDLLPLSNKIYEFRKWVFSDVMSSESDKMPRKYGESPKFIEITPIRTELELLSFLNTIAFSFSTDQYGSEGEMIRYIKGIRRGNLPEPDMEKLRDIHSEALNVIKIMQFGSWQKSVNLINDGIWKVGTNVVRLANDVNNTYHLGALGILLSESVLPNAIRSYLPPPLFMGLTMFALSTPRGIGIISYGCEFLLNTGKKIRNFISPESRYAFPTIDLDKMEITEEPRNLSLEDVTEGIIANTIEPINNYGGEFREYVGSSFGFNTPSTGTGTTHED